MKKNNILKLTVLTIMLVFFGVETFAKQNSEIVYEANIRSGELIGQIMYKCNKNKLDKFAKYNYIQDNQNRIVENEISKWNNETNKWEKNSSIQYNYDNNAITIKYYKWNPTSNKYVRVESNTINKLK